MRLHKKFSLALIGVVAIFALGSYFALSKTLIPAFDELEKRSATQDVTRAHNGLKAYGRELSFTSTDWGQWDETHAYILGQNADFEGENLELDSLVALDLNLMIIYDLNGESRWSMFVDSETEEDQPVTEFIIDSATATRLTQFESPIAETAGLIRSGVGPMIISARPVTHSDASGPVVGTLVVGRLLDGPHVAELRDTAKISLDIEMTLPTDLTVRKLENQEIFGQSEQLVASETRVTRQTLHDIDGHPIAVLSVASPRSITGLRQDTVTSLIIIFAGLGTFIIIALWLVINRLVIGPISDLRQGMIRIEEDGNLSERVNMSRSDEIGDLAHAFDDMLQELDDARSRHIDQSFKAGMAEIAAGVLHNVRNSLMPVLNNVVIARDTAAGASNNNMWRAVDELLSPDVPKHRREKLLRFLHMSRDRSVEDHESIVAELGHATDQLNYVADILRDQEQYTHAEPVLEMINLAELVREASRVIPAIDDLDIDVRLADSVLGCSVRAHRVGLLQVLNNVLLNACESIARTKDPSGWISIEANSDDDGAGRQVHIAIRDSGVGIKSDTLEHIFDRGYSSKRDGSGGLGLHWSANAITSMGGRMTAFSEGLGKGAELRITLKAIQDR